MHKKIFQLKKLSVHFSVFILLLTNITCSYDTLETESDLSMDPVRKFSKNLPLENQVPETNPLESLQIISSPYSDRQGNSYSTLPSITADGRYMVFESRAGNLSPGDNNNHIDIYLYDRLKGIKRISNGINGREPNGNSNKPKIAANGRFVTFQSKATNLTDHYISDQTNVFLHDLETGDTRLVSIGLDGRPGSGNSPSINADGSYIAFESSGSNLVPDDNNGKIDIFIYESITGQIHRPQIFANSNYHCLSASISADGMKVAFYTAGDMVPEDINGLSDVFVYDRNNNTIELVSKTIYGTSGNDRSYYPAISGDGKVVSFHSDSSDLVENDTNNCRDIFVHDIENGITTRVSVGNYGSEANDYSLGSSMSYDGRYIAFGSKASNLVNYDNNQEFDIFIRDRESNRTFRASLYSGYNAAEPDNASMSPSISSGGRFIAFTSWASNLVEGDTNGHPDVFLRTIDTQTTIRVSMADPGLGGNNKSSGSGSVSNNGRYVAYSSYATNLVTGDTNNRSDIFVRDLLTGAVKRVSLSSSGAQGNNHSFSPEISGNGRYVTFTSYASNLVTGDTNRTSDIFRYDIENGSITRVSVTYDEKQSNGASSNPSINYHGNIIAFESYATNLDYYPIDDNGKIDIYVRDLRYGTTERVSHQRVYGQGVADGNSYSPSVDYYGSNVAFYSSASNLVYDDTNGKYDIFIANLEGWIDRVSVAEDGTQANGHCYGPELNGKRRFVTFYSSATNLVSGDWNAKHDIFVKELATGVIRRVSVADDGTQANGHCYSPSTSEDGRFTAFYSHATNFVPGDTNGRPDIFLYDDEIQSLIRITEIDGVQTNGPSYYPKLSPDGEFLTFMSYADNILPYDRNNNPDIFYAIVNNR